MTTAALMNKLDTIERTLREVKLANFMRSSRQRFPSSYAESAVLRAAKEVREDVWQTRYAKKVKSVS